jgi:hypothetical protein
MQDNSLCSTAQRPAPHTYVSRPHLPDADIHVITPTEHIGCISAELDSKDTLHALGCVHLPRVAACADHGKHREEMCESYQW